MEVGLLSGEDTKEENIIVSGEAFGFCEVSGNDIDTFLQGQLTCNLDDLKPGLVLPGAACNLKGRMYTSFAMARCASDRVVMRMARGLLEVSIETLKKYAVFSRSELRDASGDWHWFGLSGDKLANYLEQKFGALPLMRNQMIQKNGEYLIKADNIKPRFELWSAHSAPTIVEETSDFAIAGEMNDWRLAMIRAGLVDLETGTTDEFLPQMLELDKLGGVSFKKGCYTGQEIVTRAKYRGTIKKRLYRIAGACNVLPEEGAEIIDPDTNRAIGKVVSAAVSRADTFEALAVLSTKEGLAPSELGCNDCTNLKVCEPAEDLLSAS